MDADHGRQEVTFRKRSSGRRTRRRAREAPIEGLAHHAADTVSRGSGPLRSVPPSREDSENEDTQDVDGAVSGSIPQSSFGGRKKELVKIRSNHGMQELNARVRASRINGISQAPTLADYEDTGEYAEVEQREKAPDYSETGLFRLAQRFAGTEPCVTDVVEEPTPEAEIDPPSKRGKDPKTGSNFVDRAQPATRADLSADIDARVSRLDEILASRSRMGDHPREYGAGRSSGTEFVSSQMEIDDAVLLPSAEVKLGDMEDSGGGTEDETWVQEQLKRAGQIDTAALRKAEDERFARRILDAETSSHSSTARDIRGLRDSLLEELASYSEAQKARYHQQLIEVGAIDNARGRGVEEEASAEQAHREASERESVYMRIKEELSAISEALESLGGARHRAEEHFRTLSKTYEERWCKVDEFGRYSRPTMSPDSDEEIAESLDKQNMSKADAISTFGRESLPRNVSVASVMQIFAHWQAQYPKDYVAAFGDLLLGKMAGAVGVFEFSVRDSAWLEGLPKDAQPCAAIQSRYPERLAIAVLAQWNPRSRTSTMELRSVCTLVVQALSTVPVEQRKAARMLGFAFYERCALEIEAMIGALSSGDLQWEDLLRSIMKCVTNTGSALQRLPDPTVAWNVKACQRSLSAISQALAERPESDTAFWLHRQTLAAAIGSLVDLSSESAKEQPDAILQDVRVRLATLAKAPGVHEPIAEWARNALAKLPCDADGELRAHP